MKWRHKQQLLEAWERSLAWWDWWRGDPKRMLKHCLLVLIAIWAIYGLKMWACSLRLFEEGPSWNPSSSAGWALYKYDDDGDGAIGPEELEESPGLKASTARIDLNNDGKLDRGEIAARLRFYDDCRDYLVKTVCRVTLDGKPLAGATVRLRPDWFIRSTIDQAEGTTDSRGRAVMSIPGEPDEGVHPGIYSVEISLLDGAGEPTEDLPARYNSTTTLGYEAAPDGGPEGLEPVFELSSQQVGLPEGEQ